MLASDFFRKVIYMANKPHENRVTMNLRIWKSERELIYAKAKELGLSNIDFVVFCCNRVIKNGVEPTEVIQFIAERHLKDPDADNKEAYTQILASLQAQGVVIFPGQVAADVVNALADIAADMSELEEGIERLALEILINKSDYTGPINDKVLAAAKEELHNTGQSGALEQIKSELRQRIQSPAKRAENE